MQSAYAPGVVRSIIGWAIAGALAGACGGAKAAEPRAEAAPPTARLLARARVAERERRYDQARALYEQAAREAPDRTSAARAWRELARALLFWGELRDAESALTRAVSATPGEVGAWHDLGVVRARLGDSAGAERALARAISLAPAEPRPRIALAAMMVNQRRWDDALAQYRALEVMELSGRMRAAVTRAIELVEASRARPPR
jgi:Flp pilus assembly protein TadD